MSECADYAVVRAAVEVLQTGASAAGGRHHTLQDVIPHVRVSRRAAVHEDVDEFHRDRPYPTWLTSKRQTPALAGSVLVRIVHVATGHCDAEGPQRVLHANRARMCGENVRQALVHLRRL